MNAYCSGSRIEESEVFELPFEPPHPHPVGERREDLAGLERGLLLLGRGKVLQGLHIVQAVSQLDDDNPEILAHRDEHLAEIFRLALLAADERELA